MLLGHGEGSWVQHQYKVPWGGVLYYVIVMCSTWVPTGMLDRFTNLITNICMFDYKIFLGWAPGKENTPHSRTFARKEGVNPFRDDG